jgi:hypothetical protein
MTIDSIKQMLQELIYFSDSEISHTFTQSDLQFSVCCIQQEDEIGIKNYFQITIIESNDVKTFDTVDAAASAIEKLINSKSLETTK